MIESRETLIAIILKRLKMWDVGLREVELYQLAEEIAQDIMGRKGTD